MFWCTCIAALVDAAAKSKLIDHFPTAHLIALMSSTEVQDEPPRDASPSNDEGAAHQIRVTTHGKIRVWVKFAMDFFDVRSASRPCRCVCGSCTIWCALGTPNQTVAPAHAFHKA